MLDVQIDWGEGFRHVRTPVLAVSNNLYDDGFGLLLRRKALDSGQLGVYVARKRSALALLRLMGRLVLGRWRQDEALDCFAVNRLTVTSRRRGLSMVNDGEVKRLNAPLHYKILPSALRVLAPY
jgi:diacylglycerol kinase family enzyme